MPVVFFMQSSISINVLNIRLKTRQKNGTWLANGHFRVSYLNLTENYPQRCRILLYSIRDEQY